MKRDMMPMEKVCKTIRHADEESTIVQVDERNGLVCCKTLKRVVVQKNQESVH